MLPVALGWAAPEIMSIDEITPGMQGIAKTVVSGTTLEEFGIEVLSVMKDKGPAGDLILVRTFGDVIDRTGGIAQGMSGSPVYINNKLVGAVAYGWSLTDHKIGMVTPIGSMLKLLDLPENHNDSLVPKATVPGFEDMATPLMVSGFTQNSLSLLQDKLAPFKLMPYAVGTPSGSPTGITYGNIEPGSAIGVELVRGDVSVAALGTVTYVDDGKVLAFGHPFLKKGNIGYFMTNAYIFTTVSGLENSFKVGTTGDLVGIINQDRSAGVSGVMGKYPTIIPMRIMVQDHNTKGSQDAEVQVVKDEQLAPVLAATTVFNVIDKAMDRTGPGTAKVSFEISGPNVPGGVLKRENMFYSPANIGEAAIGEFFEAMLTLVGNPYHPVDIIDVKVNVAVDEERRTASIINVQSKSQTARPGDKIDLAVQLKPFRGEPVTRLVSYTVPKEQPIGPLALEVRGGGIVPLVQLLAKSQGSEGDVLVLSQAKANYKNLDDVVNDFTARDHNNDIVVESLDIGVPVVGAVGSDQSKNEKQMKLPDNNVANSTNPGLPKEPKATLHSQEKQVQGKVKSYTPTDYIIDGDTQLTINIIQ